MGFDLGGGGNAFPFDHIGASVTGKITEIGEQQQTDMKTGEPAFWQGGQPKMMVRVVLQTDAHDDQGDEGLRSIYLRGSKKAESQSLMAAVIQAVSQATGRTELDLGATLTVTYVGDGQPPSPGMTAPKRYTASYVPPRVDLATQGQPPTGPVNVPAIQGPPAAPAAGPTQVASQSLGGPQNGAGGQPGASGAVMGWLNGQAVTPDLLAAFQAAGTDPRTMPGFIPAP